mmetsp:Transcript_22364/g.43827  ORF Transcript_22364/g.43827 Transcript_22364/m.43827 type:complete len:203 (+) Transcript_22364:2689-3297(+)
MICAGGSSAFDFLLAASKGATGAGAGGGVSLLPISRTLALMIRSCWSVRKSTIRLRASALEGMRWPCSCTKMPGFTNLEANCWLDSTGTTWSVLPMICKLGISMPSGMSTSAQKAGMLFIPGAPPSRTNCSPGNLEGNAAILAAAAAPIEKAIMPSKGPSSDQTFSSIRNDSWKVLSFSSSLSMYLHQVLTGTESPSRRGSS